MKPILVVWTVSAFALLPILALAWVNSQSPLLFWICVLASIVHWLVGLTALLVLSFKKEMGNAETMFNYFLIVFIIETILLSIPVILFAFGYSIVGFGFYFHDQ